MTVMFGSTVPAARATSGAVRNVGRRFRPAPLLAAAALCLVGVAVPASPAAATTGVAGISVDLAVSNSENNVSSIDSPAIASSGTDPKVVIAYVAADGPHGSRQTVSGISGCGLSWLGSGGETVSNQANDQDGVAAAYYAVSYNTLTDCVVRARLGTGGYAASITVTVLSGASRKVTFSKAGGPEGAPQAIAQASAGSLVFGVGNDWDGAVSRSLLPGQSIVSETVNTDVGDTFWVQRFDDPATAAGPVTVGATAPDDHQWNLVTVTAHPAA